MAGTSSPTAHLTCAKSDHEIEETKMQRTTLASHYLYKKVSMTQLYWFTVFENESLWQFSTDTQEEFILLC